MLDTLIISQQRKLKNTSQYVGALKAIGLSKFSTDRRGCVYIDGRPFDQMMAAIVRTELRDCDYQFSWSWMVDTIGGLANNQADISTMQNVPDWMKPKGSMK